MATKRIHEDEHFDSDETCIDSDKEIIWEHTPPPQQKRSRVVANRKLPKKLDDHVIEVTNVDEKRKYKTP